MHHREPQAGSLPERDDVNKSALVSPQLANPTRPPELLRYSIDTHSKSEAIKARPCGVIAPERPQRQPSPYNVHLAQREPWPIHDAGYNYAAPPNHSAEFVPYPQRNISPRQTFQENMKRILVPPRCDVSKIIPDATLPVAGYNYQPKNTKINVNAETKHFNVPYIASQIPKPQRTSVVRNNDVYSQGVATSVPAAGLHRWPYVAPTSHAPPPYVYQHDYFPHHQSYASATLRPAKLPNKKNGEEVPPVYGEDFYRGGDIRFEPHSAVKDKQCRLSENAEENKEKDEKEDSNVDENGVKKEEVKEAGSTAARNLWVSGLSGDTRAKDLKQLCSKHGKVIGAKVVTNARTPGSRCYGYVTMASAQDAENCIKNLHRTELHGRMISVEKAKSEASGSGPAGNKRKEEPRRKSDEKKELESKKEGEENGDDKAKTDTEDRADSVRSQSKDKMSASDRKGRERSRERKRSPRDALTFNKIWKERDRERSRLARDEERRRRQAEAELRERERQQRDENRRLAHERHKLRLERERIEREKKELLRLERERHKLEREKLELERMELKRAQIRLEEERRKRYEAASSYRKPASPPPPPPYERDRHKRPPPPSLTRSAFEAPPPPRFEMSSSYDRSADKRDRADYKRDYASRHVSSSSGKYPSNGTATDSSRPPLLPASRPKEPARTAYEGREGRGAGYRSPPPTKTESRTWTSSSRYQDNAPASKEYPERSGSAWAGGKTYPSSRHTVSAAAPAHNWTKPGSGSAGDTWPTSGTGERYGASYEPRAYPPAAYQPPPPGATYPDRYPPTSARDYRHKY